MNTLVTALCVLTGSTIGAAIVHLAHRVIRIAVLRRRGLRHWSVLSIGDPDAAVVIYLRMVANPTTGPSKKG
jgi:hypothetical protein